MENEVGWALRDVTTGGDDDIEKHDGEGIDEMDASDGDKDAGGEVDREDEDKDKGERRSD